MRTIKICFHNNPHDWIGRLVRFVGNAAGYDMTYSHCSLAATCRQYHLTWFGIEEADELYFAEHSPAVDIIVIRADDLDLFCLSERMRAASMLSSRVSIPALLLMLFRVRSGLLCTDLIQLGLGEPLEHLTPKELYDKYKQHDIHQAHELSEVQQH